MSPTQTVAPNLRLCVYEITNNCNLKCEHCLVSAGRADPDQLSTRESLRLIDELAACGCLAVALTGGEPLVRKDWHVLASRIIERGMSVSLATNGMLVDDAAVSKMVEIGVSGVAVSLDGARETHSAIRGPGTYDRAVDAIGRLVSREVATGVMTQVHRENLGELEQMFDGISAMGVKKWQLQLAVPAGRLLNMEEKYLLEVSDLPALDTILAGLARRGGVEILVSDNIGYFGRHEPLLRKNPEGKPLFWTGCQAGLQLVGIRPNGDVKGCPSLPNEFSVGNLRETSFRDIWNNDEGFPYTRKWDETLLEGGCKRCPLARICRAGCTCMAYAVTGTVYDNPYCLQRV